MVSGDGKQFVEMNETFSLRLREKLASKGCIITTNYFTVYRQWVKHCDPYLTLKNNERIEKIFLEESSECTKTSVGIQGERAFF